MNADLIAEVSAEFARVLIGVETDDQAADHIMQLALQLALTTAARAVEHNAREEQIRAIFRQAGDLAVDYFRELSRSQPTESVNVP